MIAIDTSSLISFFNGDSGSDVLAVEMALEQHLAVLPPIVLSEILSAPHLPTELMRLIRQVPLLELKERFWERAGLLRAKILAKNLKARLADTLIAQICVDHHVALITRDKDFKHFTKVAGLKILP
jgi:predicted nucleic acid-binding protein